jgi:uncharacterized protein (DUF885 family)
MKSVLLDRRRLLTGLGAAALLPACALPPTRQDADARVHAVVAAHWEATLRQQPELASILGDRRYNAQLRSVSPAAVEAQLREARGFVRQLEAIAPDALSTAAALDRELLLRELREQLDTAWLHADRMPVDQFEGVHVNLPQLVPLLPFDTPRDFEDYAARLEQVPRLFAETQEQMRLGLRDGLVPPRPVVSAVLAQAQGLASQAAATHPLAMPLGRIPPAWAPQERERIRARIVGLVDGRVLPAYRDFARFVAAEYLPRARESVGLWALPDGAKRYAAAIRSQTTTGMTPDAIHALGLSEVARIEAEQMAIVRSLGGTDLASFNAGPKTLPRVHAASERQILDEFRGHIAQMQEVVPRVFGRLPRARLEVVPVEAFRQQQAPAAAYASGTPDGSRPARVYVNTFNSHQQLTITFESTAYHEGVPGHHLQRALAQELPSLAPFRQQMNVTAFVEGWAVYAERLGKELGFYRDAYKDYGRLADEKLRAVRLVVDTGLHHRRWTREQVVAYMREHTTETEASIAEETDRYIALPAQALAYKIGQLTILRLREEARTRLGPRFDIRNFHDLVLGAGALPLDVLERRVRAWDGSNGRTTS